MTGISNHLTGFCKIRVFTRRHFKASFYSHLFFVDFKQNEYIYRGDYTKIDENSTNLQEVKAIALRKIYSMI